MPSAPVIYKNNCSKFLYIYISHFYGQKYAGGNLGAIGSHFGGTKIWIRHLLL